MPKGLSMRTSKMNNKNNKRKNITDSFNQVWNSQCGWTFQQAPGTIEYRPFIYLCAVFSHPNAPLSTDESASLACAVICITSPPTKSSNTADINSTTWWERYKMTQHDVENGDKKYKKTELMLIWRRGVYNRKHTLPTPVIMWQQGNVPGW